MTAGTSLSGGGASRWDHEALEQLNANDAQRLATVRGRAEKWIGGLTALTGLLGTVLIIKGPERVADLMVEWRVAVAVLITVAVGLLAWATYSAYRSAHGEAGTLAEVDRQPLQGLHERLMRRRVEVAAEAQSQLRQAVVLTFAGVAALVVATGVTWFAPAAEADAAGNICVVIDGEPVVEIAADSLPVVTVSDGVTLAPCK